jgi:predicted nuclease of predicted toxin-antitoxin system
MLKLLLNANLSPETAQFLRQKFHFDVRCLLEDGLGQITDEEVVALAKKEGRIIVTFDLDFGQIYHFREPEKLGILVLRLRNQTVERVNQRLKEFFSGFEDLEKLSRALTVVGDSHYRFYRSGDSS